MANPPKFDMTGITDSQGLLQQLFSYMNSLNAGGAAPQVGAAMPDMGGLHSMMKSLRHTPMQTMPGGGIDTAIGSNAYRSANNLAANPARAAIRQQQIGAGNDVMGQNLQLSQANLFNTMGMQDMIDSLMGGAAGQLGQIGTYPPYLRGMSKSTGAAGTGGGGSMFGSFGF